MCHGGVGIKNSVVNRKLHKIRLAKVAQGITK